MDMINLKDALPESLLLASRSLTIAATGQDAPTLLKDCGKPAMKKLYNDLTGLFGNLTHHNFVSRVITGGNTGTEQLAFWAVRENDYKEQPRIANMVYIPYGDQAKNWPEDGPFGRKNYKAMLKAAAAVIDICEDPQLLPDDPRAPEWAKDPIDAALMAEAESCYRTRNEFMLGDSDFAVVLIRKGSDEHLAGKGPAMDFVRRAHAKKKPVLLAVWDPETPAGPYGTSSIATEWKLPA